MRTRFLLIGTLALLLGACSSQKSKVPPLPHKEWLVGKWKNSAQAQFLTGYEFDKDGGLKVMFQGLKEPIAGKYTWSDDRTVVLEYAKSAEVEKTYEAAAKTFKEQVNERIQTKKLDGRAGPSLLRSAADKLPEKDTFTVGLVDPKYLILSRPDVSSMSFEKVD